MNWLTSLLMEAMDAAFEWLSSQSEIWSISKENLADNRTKFMQVFAFNVQSPDC